MTEIETEEQRDERGKRLLARLRALDLTPAEQHEALVFLSGFSVSGVETALDRCERERRESLAENRRWPRADAAAIERAAGEHAAQLGETPEEYAEG
jgi:hypothetical protein